MNTLKETLARGELMRVFSLNRVLDPIVVEMFACSGGYHGFWIDQEHGVTTSQCLATLALAGRANDLDCFVRIPPTGYWHVTQCLEAGAGGVMAAQIHSADQARQFVSWAKFAPDGTRGLNASGRDADYAYIPAAEFVVQANARTMVAIQIETLGSVAQAREIAAIDGVDLLFIGPADLSLALGVPGEFDHDKLWEAIATVAFACRAEGKAWGAVTPTAAFADRAIELGCQMPTMGNDVLVMKRGLAAFQETFRRYFGQS